MSLEIPFGVKVLSNQPLDSKQHAPDGTPWASVAAANAGLPAGERYKGLRIHVVSGASVADYVYDDGISDGHLVKADAAVTAAATAASDAQSAAEERLLISDVINDLTTVADSKALSATMGKSLKLSITDLDSALSTLTDATTDAQTDASSALTASTNNATAITGKMPKEGFVTALPIPTGPTTFTFDMLGKVLHVEHFNTVIDIAEVHTEWTSTQLDTAGQCTISSSSGSTGCKIHVGWNAPLYNADRTTVQLDDNYDVTLPPGVHKILRTRGLCVLVLGTPLDVVVENTHGDQPGGYPILNENAEVEGDIVVGSDTHANVAATTLLAGAIVFDEGTKEFRGGDGVSIGGKLLGGYPRPITVTTDTTVVDGVVLVDAAAGSVTITLPTPALGLQLTVKKIDAEHNNTVTVTPTAGATIDGQPVATLVGQYATLTLVSTATTWYII